ncbi:MAG TPA: TIGR01244 family sulfur transferase [Pseudolabrys sp.]|nr:TIGR01244 family sulfur transferase [Pseudolabrys sp.]
MVKIIPLEPEISVAAKLGEADFAELAARGFRSVVNLLPDGETPDQLSSAHAEALARRHGLAFRYRPVMVAEVTDDEVVDDFARLIDELPAPILVYCKSAGRSTTLWAQAAAGRLGIDQALAVAREAGYDLEVLRDSLAERGEWLSAATPADAAVSMASGG